MEAVSAMGQQSDLVVHALEAGVGEFGFDELEDAVGLLPDGSRESHERVQARAAGPGSPMIQGSL